MASVTLSLEKQFKKLVRNLVLNHNYTNIHLFQNRDRKFFVKFLLDADEPLPPFEEFEFDLHMAPPEHFEDLHPALQESVKSIYNFIRNNKEYINANSANIPTYYRYLDTIIPEVPYSTEIRAARYRGGCGCMVPQQGGYTSENPKSNPLKGKVFQGGYRATKKDKKYLRLLKQGKSIGFTMTASLKAKGLIKRANGTRRISKKYRH